VKAVGHEPDFALSQLCPVREQQAVEVHALRLAESQSTLPLTWEGPNDAGSEALPE
jgi:hypothetical protein